MATEPKNLPEESLNYQADQADPVLDEGWPDEEEVASSVAETREAPTEALTEEPTEGPTEKPVPLAALQDERTKRQVAEQQIKDLTARFDKVVAALIANKTPDEKPVESAIPEYATDPLGHLRTKNEMLLAELKALREEVGTFKTSTGEKQHIAAQAERLRHDVLTYAQTVPDVEKAFQHYTNVEYQELHAIGWSDDEIAKNIGNKVLDVVTRCYAAGKNPAEVLYTMAKNKGYTAVKKPNGEDPAPATSSMRMDPKSARGFDKTSKRGVKMPSGEAIHAMSEDEFNRFMDDNKLTWKDINR